MSVMATTASDATALEDCRVELRRLTAELADTGFISPGSLVRRYTRCNKPGCRCQGDPPRPHGPYWQWTRAVGGKTLTRRVTEDQVPLYQEWIANRRRLQGLIADIQEISGQAAEILLNRPQLQTDNRLDAGR